MYSGDAYCSVYEVTMNKESSYSVLFVLIRLINLQVNFYSMSFLQYQVIDKQSLIVFASQLDQDFLISFYHYKLLHLF